MEQLCIQKSDHTAPIHIDFSHWRQVLAWNGTIVNAQPKVLSDRLLHLLLPHLLRFLLERERLTPFPHVSIPVAFQNLWSGSPNGAIGYPNVRPHL
ncbi:hypothetical protein AVEN_180877-1 [Araneus ventricosus]|uniref:Uncharacterized protein n=1 Tax=Araneus ventricosus TaxID=182803 RepID=A0A4Y2WDX4_ARAVE|nr:hypothetical protein AVEN_180877-1 [Araneus ventricosus]